MSITDKSQVESTLEMLSRVMREVALLPLDVREGDRDEGRSLGE